MNDRLWENGVCSLGRPLRVLATPVEGATDLLARWVRCRMLGTFDGEPFESVSPDESPGMTGYWPSGDPGDYWWAEGNAGCGCNKGQHVGLKLQCHEGGRVLIDTIQPLDAPELPTLLLNESGRYKIVEDGELLTITPWPPGRLVWVSMSLVTTALPGVYDREEQPT